MTEVQRSGRRQEWQIRRACPWLMGAVLSLLAGCTDASITALCEEAEDCAGGGDDAYDACIIRMEAYEDLAAVHGCEAEWEDFLLCFEENAECDEDDDELEPEDKCDDEEDDFEDCVD